MGEQWYKPKSKSDPSLCRDNLVLDQMCDYGEQVSKCAASPRNQLIKPTSAVKPTVPQ